MVYDANKTYQVEKLRFYAFQHPWVCDFVESLNAGGIHMLLGRKNQRLGESVLKSPITFNTYSPTEVVVGKEYWPLKDVDFDIHGAYAQYNWELFFHVSLYIATRLMQDQRHEEAMRWFHYIFNPMTSDKSSVPQRYWNFKPFRDQGVPERIQELLWTLQDPSADKKKKGDVEAAIADWREHPFQPHRIARGRPGAYMKTVVMKYIDNLIAWGDKLFRRDTIESINEATQLYILAANLLGARPQRVPAPTAVKSETLTYKELRTTLDKFSNAAVLAENIIVHSPFTFGGGNGASNGSETLYGLASLAFCIPHNEKLVGYWDTVEDRLFKIRHCMNIEGVVRQLPLFEPPIDPALLVRATAMGLDLSQVLDDLAAPLPHYRFTFMLQKAREFCEELKQLGGLLLSALEKRDAEKLSQIRATHEKDLLKAVLEVKKKQVKEAEQNIAGLEKAREMAESRKQHYEAISNRLPEEKQFLDKQGEAVVLQIASQMAALGGSMAAAAPDVYVFVDGLSSGVLTKAGGGDKFGMIANLFSTHLGWLGQIASLEGTTASYKGGLIRAQQDRDLQIKLATHEIQQIDKQIVAADIRRQIAENELANHDKQIEQSTQIEEFLREKFTNQALYNWMVSQVSAVYFQAYKLVYDMAKRAERMYRHELGITDSGFVRFGAWDSLHKGLLAGEKLSLDLRRLETAYLEQNRREFELTKHISLVLLDPLALLQLRATGRCTVMLPEALFDMDGPGHYFRRIKTVAVSIPCVTGPYANVNCTLTLLNHSMRHSNNASGNYTRDIENDDPRFIDSFGAIQSIVTSSAQNDSGMFETNLRDERYLPFEGAGVISTWRVELPSEYRQFNYDTISDVILHIRYTAREGGARLKTSALNNINSLVKNAEAAGSVRVFSVRHEFPTEWARFHGHTPGANQRFELALNLRAEHYPFWSQGRLTSVTRVDLLARSTKATIPASLDVFDKVDQNDATGKKDTLAKEPALGNLLVGELTNIGLPSSPVGEVKFFFEDREIDDLWVAVTWGK